MLLNPQKALEPVVMHYLFATYVPLCRHIYIYPIFSRNVFEKVTSGSRFRANPVDVSTRREMGLALLNLRSFWKIQSFWRKVARNVKFILKLMGKWKKNIEELAGNLLA
jgi:hypothetical protein